MILNKYNILDFLLNIALEKCMLKIEIFTLNFFLNS